MRILIVHNFYKHCGGEDSVVDSEIELLRNAGHELFFYYRNNKDIKNISLFFLAAETLWSLRTLRDFNFLVMQNCPDIIHVHNTFPLISPSIYWAARRVKIPVIQTLHNFRFMCLNALFLRNGQICEDCMARFPWKGVQRACYRNSRLSSAILAGMLALHRGLGTYRNQVTRYIALNEFCRKKFIEGGLPPERVVVKPNFVNFDYLEHTSRANLLFVGRLSMEKGIMVLAEAMRMLPDVKLRVIGDGPQGSLLNDIRGVLCLGTQPAETVRKEMSRALALVLPSICYENFPRTIVEAFASGLPVIASRIGALADIVTDGKTGLLFDPCNARDLADKMVWAVEHPSEMARIGHNARAEFEARFSPEVNYKQLMDIYVEAIAQAQDSKCKVQGESTKALSPATWTMKDKNRITGNVLGSHIDALSWKAALDHMKGWSHERKSRYVSICNAHVVVTASQDATYCGIINESDMATPDGAPVAWMLRRQGFANQPRISGPDVMWTLCEHAARENIAIYCYGSTEATLGLLEARLLEAFPTLKIMTESPPFRTLTIEEDAIAVDRINSSNAGIIFVGLGCPKQEYWMAEHRGRVNAVMIGVGAAFDFHAGTIKRAPKWMQNVGLEWLHRLASEPRRLWKRYLITNTLFTIGAAKQLLKKKIAKKIDLRAKK
jgi:exopolysaccharide biosynthesis WecB/TagA/CpsF family protein